MRESLHFYINGKEHCVSGADAFLPLSSYLRYVHGATGTKVVCAEGDCGACTVLSGRLYGDKIKYKPVNSCIQFLYQLDLSCIVTVEGLEQEGKLHPVQEAMVNNHGAQCGYCTPGFVMAMCALFDKKKTAGTKDVKDALTGNLCRCTGYEPILTAAANVDVRQIIGLNELYPPEPMVKTLQQYSGKSVEIAADSRLVCLPATTEQAVKFKFEHPQAVVVSGGTDVCVNCNKRGLEPREILSLANIAGLDELAVEDKQLVVGSRTTLAALEQWACEHLPELAKIMWLFGSPQIRGAGTLAGNIANGSPIADTLPWLFVMEARVELAGVEGKRLIDINSLYKGYKKLDMSCDELITRVFIPLPEAGQTIRLFKVSKRQHLDISTFTAAIAIKIKGNKIEQAKLACGGVAPVVLRLPETEAFLAGRPATLATFQLAGKLARGEISPISDVRGSSDFRYQLAENIFLKFYHECVDKREYACRP